MNWKLSSLMCASFALLGFLGHGTSVQAQAYVVNNSGNVGYGIGVAPVYGVGASPGYGPNSPYNTGCCCMGGRGWYQRSFGPDYCFSGICGYGGLGCCGPEVYGCSLHGCGARPLFHRRSSCGSCCPAVATITVAACCNPAPNCCGAFSCGSAACGSVMASPSMVSPAPRIAVPAAPLKDSPSTPTPAPATPAPPADSPKPSA